MCDEETGAFRAGGRVAIDAIKEEGEPVEDRDCERDWGGVGGVSYRSTSRRHFCEGEEQAGKNGGHG